VIERIYINSKSLNISLQVFQVFNEFDPEKTGYVSHLDFKVGIQTKLNSQDIKELDLDFIGQKYKAARSGPQGMVQIEKFFNDFERIEKMGVKALEDPFRRDQPPEQEVKPISLPIPVQNLYQQMGRHIKQGDAINKTQHVTMVSDELVRRDTNKSGFLSEQNIREAFTILKIYLSQNKQNSQMELLVTPLPQDPSNLGSYGYLYMLELLFSRETLVQIMQRHGLPMSLLQGMPSQKAVAHQPIDSQPLNMDVGLRDRIEVRYGVLSSYVHQISAGSSLLKEVEFYSVFSRCYIQTNQQDVQMLQIYYRRNFSKQSQSVDFKGFLSFFKVQEQPSKILAELQKQLELKKVNLAQDLNQDLITYDLFNQLLTKNKILLTPYTTPQVEDLFKKMAEQKQKIQKNELIRILTGQFGKVEPEKAPFIVNEFVYYIVNHNIDIFKVINAKVKILNKA